MLLIKLEVAADALPTRTEELDAEKDEILIGELTVALVIALAFELLAFEPLGIALFIEEADCAAAWKESNALKTTALARNIFIDILITIPWKINY